MAQSDSVFLLARVVMVVGIAAVLLSVLLFGSQYAVGGLVVTALVAVMLLYGQLKQNEEEKTFEEVLKSVDQKLDELDEINRRLEERQGWEDDVEEELETLRQEVDELSDAPEDSPEVQERQEQETDEEESEEKERLRE